MGALNTALHSFAQSITQFQWRRGITPLSSPVTLAALVLLYLAGVLALHLTVKRPVSVPLPVAALHNAILCFGSLAMFVGTAYESYQVRAGHFAYFTRALYPTGSTEASFLCAQGSGFCKSTGDPGKRLNHLAFLLAKRHTY